MKISHTVKSKSKLSLCQTHRPPKCKLHAKIVKWLIHGTKDSKALVDNHSSHSDRPKNYKKWAHTDTYPKGNMDTSKLHIHDTEQKEPMGT